MIESFVTHSILDRFLASLRRRLPETLSHFVPKRSFLVCRDFCGNPDLTQRSEQIVARDYERSAELIFDWSNKHTTPDQLRIEHALSALQHKDARILHVGVGNSGFAQRWYDKVGDIVGITIAAAEKQHAVELGLPNYTCQLINKYDSKLMQLTGKFDFIIDNNPSLAACCEFHFFTMWCNYRFLLKAGGMLLTDREGMSWVIPSDDLRWSLDDRDLGWIADCFGFSVTRTGEDDSVRLLTRTT
jgi:hypothetical protein